MYFYFRKRHKIVKNSVFFCGPHQACFVIFIRFCDVSSVIQETLYCLSVPMSASNHQRSQTVQIFPLYICSTKKLHFSCIRFNLQNMRNTLKTQNKARDLTEFFSNWNFGQKLNTSGYHRTSKMFFKLTAFNWLF